MIYLVSNQQNLFDPERYKSISLEEAFEILNPLKEVQFDTETQGLDPFTKKLLTIQLGNKDNQVVFDCLSYDPVILKDYFESKRTFIGWNLSFDLKFLYKHNIWPQHLYDGMIVEQLIYLGYSKSSIKYSLKEAAKRWLNIDIDKSVRGQIINVGLTPQVVEYAANDVKYLEDIKEEQMIEVKKQNMEKAVELENSFVRVLAYMEFCGVKLDINKWKSKMAKDRAKLDEAERGLNDWVVNYYKEHQGNNSKIKIEAICDTQWEHNPEIIAKHYYYIDINKLPKSARYYTRPSEEFGILYCAEYEIPFPIKTDLQGDLWSGFDTEPKCTINWNSPKQIIPLFELLGFKLDTFDKKTKEKKKSVDSKTIEKQKEVSSIAPIYLKYKEAAKVCSAFGQNWLDAINPVTGRIHPNYYQLGTDTARLSSGGGLSQVNIQQLPNDFETRACFVSEKGNKFISADYSGQESALLASIANDPLMLKELNEGNGDIHSLVASLVFKKELEGISLKDIKKNFHELRQIAKGYEFLVAYGGDAATIEQNYGKSHEEAVQIYNSYMEGLTGVQKYQNYCRQAVIRDGFILMNPLTGHKAHIEDWDEIKEIRDLMKEEGFWENYRYLKKYDPYNPLLTKIRNFFKRKADLEKKSINFRIQNRGAMCFKLSGILLFNWIIANNYQNVIKLCVGAHDEWDTECPEDISEKFASILVECMEKGGKPFCTRTKLSADIARLEDNSLPNYWIH